MSRDRNISRHSLSDGLMRSFAFSLAAVICVLVAPGLSYGQTADCRSAGL